VAFASWSFTGQWRGYQSQCLEAFEADRAAGRHQTLLVAPPGSGKTVVGLEVVRRLGAPALVLCPSRTIQRQWGEKQALFGPASADLHALTYQSLCQTSDPEGMLREAAERLWAAERAAITGQPVGEVVVESARWEGPAAARRDRDVARLVAAMKRRVAAGKLPDLPAGELLSATARERIGALREGGVRVVVLDECHHLLSLWGALLKAVLDLLEPEHVLGLTATNPRDVTAEQAALYAQLLDSEDFSVPTPAVVREGFLAPYQELVQLCEPLQSEQEWLADRHARFELALDELARVPAGVEHLGLDAWLSARLSERAAAGGGALSWAQLARRQPRLADAGLRWLHARGVAAPADAPRGERHRAALTIDDWVALLDDYTLRCLRADPSDEAARRLDALQVALGDLGFALTRQGIRRVGGEVDRVLLSSASKPLAMCDVLACEYDARGPALRAVVMCDSERPPRQPADSPLLLTGGGRGLLASAGADERLVGARPALVTGETLAVLPVDADWWAQRCCELAADGAWPAFADGLRRDAEDGVIVLRHADAAFDSQVWTAWATELLAAGETLVLIGTRGLLGEGWDCPPVNVLVDMTAVAADVSVRQMRGRSLRLDPADRAKLANNWDVVCVAPALGRGHADYGRFVRRHAHLHAPCEDGTIETGPSHVHPELSPYGPPSADRFVAINVEQQERAADRDAARARWSVGVPYRGVDLDVLVVRNPRRACAGEPPSALAAASPPRWRWLAGRRAHPEQLPLEWAAGAVCEAYVALGELPAEVAATMGFGVRPEGWVRVSLPDAEVEISRRVSAALDELFGGGALPRYVVSRTVATSPVPFLGRRTAWHAVPADLARRKERATAFHVAWQRWLGRGELVYCHGTDPRARGLAVQASSVAALETQRRRIWR
jgi:superfamily II DNA or RNA helicase